MNFEEAFMEMWFIEKYDEVVAQHGSITVEKAREIVAQAYADAVKSGDIPRDNPTAHT